MSNTSPEPDKPIVGENAPGNTVAVIGLILTLIAGLMCAVLFAVVSQLPDSQSLTQSYGLQFTNQSELDETVSPDSQAQAEPREEGTNSTADVADVPAVAKVRHLKTKRSVVQLQVLLLTSATAVLNLVGLVLSIAGLFIPGRPRAVVTSNRSRARPPGAD